MTIFGGLHRSGAGLQAAGRGLATGAEAESRARSPGEVESLHLGWRGATETGGRVGPKKRGVLENVRRIRQ